MVCALVKSFPRREREIPIGGKHGGLQERRGVCELGLEGRVETRPLEEHQGGLTALGLRLGLLGPGRQRADVYPCHVRQGRRDKRNEGRTLSRRLLKPDYLGILSGPSVGLSMGRGGGAPSARRDPPTRASLGPGRQVSPGLR